MEQGLWVLCPKSPGNLRNGIDVPKLIIHHHHGDRSRLRPHGLQYLGGGNIALLIRPQICHLIPLALHPAAALQHGAVLHGGGDDVFSHMAVLPAGGGNGPVIPLGAAGGKVHSLYITSQSSRHDLPPALHLSFHLQPYGILAAGIAEPVYQHLVHGVRHGAGHGRGSGVVQINHVAHLSKLRLGLAQQRKKRYNRQSEN